jgi:hypothetical protein
VFEAIGDDQSIVTVKVNIAIAQSMYEGCNNEEMLKATKEFYEMRVAKYGEEHEHTILAGRSYAIALRDAKRGEEVRELLTKLLATSKQVLGPHHSTTKAVDNAIIWINFITYIKSLYLTDWSVGNVVSACKMLSVHSRKFYNKIIANFAIQCSKKKSGMNYEKLKTSI